MNDTKNNNAAVFLRFALPCILLVAATTSLAGGWDMMGNHAALKNHVIADVGEVSEVNPPLDTRWSDDVFQINGRCFIFSGFAGFSDYGSNSALLLVSDQKQVKLAIIKSSINSIKVEVKEITIVQCPQGTNVLPYSDDPQERRKLLQKHLEDLERRIEAIKNRRQN
jgi:hypothetical protein